MESISDIKAEMKQLFDDEHAVKQPKCSENQVLTLETLPPIKNQNQNQKTK